MLVGVFVALVVGAPLLSAGCSSSQPPRDTNYGTDVGLGYVPPDAQSTAPADAASTGGAMGLDGGAAGKASSVYDSHPESDREDSLPADVGVVVPMACSPNCAGEACGSSDGCGGICDTGCVCVPSCAGLACGSPDGCGGVCTYGCICIPSCSPLDCGTWDGCGGSCMFGCFCFPSCGGDECGTPDGCGGTCNGGCLCSPSCGAFDCGTSDGCGGTCSEGC